MKIAIMTLCNSNLPSMGETEFVNQVLGEIRATAKPATRILNDTAGHDPMLVDQINKAYQSSPLNFKTIVHALYIRDFDECLEKGISINPNVCLMSESDLNAYLYQIADDKDLETILSFCRI